MKLSAILSLLALATMATPLAVEVDVNVCPTSDNLVAAGDESPSQITLNVHPELKELVSLEEDDDDDDDDVYLNKEDFEEFSLWPPPPKRRREPGWGPGWGRRRRGWCKRWQAKCYFPEDCCSNNCAFPRWNSKKGRCRRPGFVEEL